MVYKFLIVEMVLLIIHNRFSLQDIHPLFLLGHKRSPHLGDEWSPATKRRNKTLLIINYGIIQIKKNR